MINNIVQIKNIQMTHFTKALLQIDSSAASNDEPVTDTVHISNNAKQLQALVSKRFPSFNGETISVRDIENSLSNTTSCVEKKLQALYSHHGLSSESKMAISVGQDGTIIVNGDEPASEILGEKINDDKELSNSIRKMSANASILEAIKSHQKFSSAYDKSPISAVERFGYLLEDGHDYHVLFSLDNGQIDTKVTFI